jgi:predicted Zn-dependent protease
VAVCVAAGGGDVELAGFAAHREDQPIMGTSAGLRAAGRQTDVQLSMTARTADGTGSGWSGARSHRVGEVDARGLATTAGDKARRSRAPKRLEPGRLTVILEPAAVSDLLSFMLMQMTARAADEGRSFFGKRGGGTKVGEKLFGDGITLTSDPADPLAPALPFDNEGLPRGREVWFERGTLRGLRYTRHWAEKKGQKPTATPGLYHLHGGSAASVDELIQGTKRGVLITRFWYTRWVDQQSLLVTGLTRDGIYLVENGAVVGPVNNFRFNESPVTMLRNVEAMTRETVTGLGGIGGGGGGFGARSRVPALRTSGFNLASISEAV